MQAINDQQGQEFEDEAWRLVDYIKAATDPVDEEQRFAQLIQFFEAKLKDPNYDYSSEVFVKTSNILHENLWPDRVWKWIADVAGRDLPENVKAQLLIGVLEPCVDEPPVPIEVLDRLFRLLDSPKTVWAVLEAYMQNEDPPQCFRDDYEGVAERCRDRGVSPPPFPQEEFEQYAEGFKRYIEEFKVADEERPA